MKTDQQRKEKEGVALFVYGKKTKQKQKKKTIESRTSFTEWGNTYWAICFFLMTTAKSIK